MADARTGRKYRAARLKLKARSDTCMLCGQPINPDLKFPDPMSFSAHHHGTPYSRGGGDEHLVSTHLLCNQIQGTSTEPVIDRHSRRWY